MTKDRIAAISFAAIAGVMIISAVAGRTDGKTTAEQGAAAKTSTTAAPGPTTTTTTASVRLDPVAAEEVRTLVAEAKADAAEVQASLTGDFTRLAWACNDLDFSANELNDVTVADDQLNNLLFRGSNSLRQAALNCTAGTEALLDGVEMNDPIRKQDGVSRLRSVGYEIAAGIDALTDAAIRVEVIS